MTRSHRGSLSSLNGEALENRRNTHRQSMQSTRVPPASQSWSTATAASGQYATSKHGDTLNAAESSATGATGLGSLGPADGAAVTPMCGREAINSSPLMA